MTTQVILEMLHAIEIQMDAMQGKIESIEKCMQTLESKNSSTLICDRERVDLMIAIANSLVKRRDATIFGGFVRDMIASGMDFDDCTFDSDSPPIVPRDIDFTLTDIKSASECYILRLLRECVRGVAPDRNVTVARINKELPTEDNDDEYIHRMEMQITVKRQDEPPMTILVDYVPVNNRFAIPPFGRIDAECNAFIWDSAGVHISRNTGLDWIDNNNFISRRDTEVRIMHDIQHRTTVAHDMTSNRKDHEIFIKRIKNLANKGWSVYLKTCKGFLSQNVSGSACSKCHSTPSNSELTLKISESILCQTCTEQEGQLKK